MLQNCEFVLEIGFVQNIASFLRSTFGNRQITIEQVNMTMEHNSEMMIMTMITIIACEVTRADDDDAEAHLCAFCNRICHNCPQVLEQNELFHYFTEILF